MYSFVQAQEKDAKVVMSTRWALLAFLAAYCCPVARTKESLKVGGIEAG